MDLVSTSAKPKVALDEGLFQELLAAAYVVQQHNDAVSTPGASPTPSGSPHPPAGQIEVAAPLGEPIPSSCRVCGRPFGADDVFCGNCSMPRVAGSSSENLQSKWASLWYMQQGQVAAPPSQSQPASHNPPPNSSEPKLRGIHVESAGSSRATEATESPAIRLYEGAPSVRNSETQNAAVKMHEQVTRHDEIFRPRMPLAIISHPSPAAPSEDESVSRSDLQPHLPYPFWSRMRHRYLGWAVNATGLLILLAILAVWRSPKNAQLTLLQSLLVKLGLADVPAKPVVVKSNADASVWVDVHTGLYYCKGSDLYGTTVGGHFATQGEAQQDSFEPAERVPCP